MVGKVLEYFTRTFACEFRRKCVMREVCVYVYVCPSERVGGHYPADVRLELVIHGNTPQRPSLLASPPHPDPLEDHDSWHLSALAGLAFNGLVFV